MRRKRREREENEMKEGKSINAHEGRSELLRRDADKEVVRNGIPSLTVCHILWVLLPPPVPTPQLHHTH